MKITFEKIRELYDISDNSFGLSEHEILDCEIRLSITLPSILKEYYLQLGNNSQLNQTQYFLLLPNKIYFDKGDHLIFYSENQGNAIWGIKREELNFENPQVYITYNNDNWTSEGKLLDFLTAMAYLQSIFAFQFNANAVDISKDIENIVRDNWERVALKIELWAVEFFQNTMGEVIALINSDNQTDLFVATKTIIDFEKINKRLKVNWDYNSSDE
ncbi:hypothetical protein [Cellulophaga sp. BC115SP]|uniref:hypothetical protein n=1 Tax=Cellulophaga sp. BC115SP TaxID=2683263 RepID=UPI001413428F|nr:hypothetical protein [Cellulophaga sp. BC115SP]NBB31854.1 hypothetical protein [Cellulophaga sp. BC115SP]